MEGSRVVDFVEVFRLISWLPCYPYRPDSKIGIIKMMYSCCWTENISFDVSLCACFTCTNEGKRERGEDEREGEREHEGV